MSRGCREMYSKGVKIQRLCGPATATTWRRHAPGCSAPRGRTAVRIAVQRHSSSLADILRQVQDGSLDIDEASKVIISAEASSPKQETQEETLESFANLDHGRAARSGFPEAVFAEGKTPQQVASILDDMARSVNESIQTTGSVGDIVSTAILATRVPPEMYKEISSIGLTNGSITYHKMARIISMEASALKDIVRQESTKGKTRVVVATAGTTDLPVAEEAAVTLEAAGCKVDRIFDAGVAGLHRIVRAIPRLRDPDVGCIIVCAGMDGALPSVVGGLVSVPVIAVPTSIGYGASFGGVSAMLTMLNSCSPGVGVVNIDNGFGAAALAFKCIPPASRTS